MKAKMTHCPDCNTKLIPDGSCFYCPYCAWSGCGV